MAFRILVVEDDAATRRGMAQLLTGAGYEVTETASMTEALNLLSSNTPDLVITDLRLAEFNGLYLAAVNPQRIPVIIVTGYADRGLEAEARELGADFLLKPVKPSQLLAVVERRLPVTENGESFSLARRWPRRRPTSELNARVDDTFVRILDVSYGGLRFLAQARCQRVVQAVVPHHVPEGRDLRSCARRLAAGQRVESTLRRYHSR